MIGIIFIAFLDEENVIGREHSKRKAIIKGMKARKGWYNDSYKAYNILTTHFVTILGSQEFSVGVGKDSGR